MTNEIDTEFVLYLTCYAIHPIAVFPSYRGVGNQVSICTGRKGVREGGSDSAAEMAALPLQRIFFYLLWKGSTPLGSWRLADASDLLHGC